MSMDKMIPLMLGGIKDTLYMTTVSTLFAYLLGLPLAILLVLTAPRRPQAAKAGLPPARYGGQHLPFHPVPDSDDSGHPRDPRDCGQGLRLHGDDRSAGHRGRAVCRPHDRILAARGRSRRDRGGAVDGREHPDNHLQGAHSGGQNVADRRRDDLPAARFSATARCPARLAAAVWGRLPSATATTAIRRTCSSSPSPC